ncbi:hypothetical protein [Streptomyces sp. enrichment culture]|uniref:hypothetical protein n=1 Tax=Streptomyces sp. enrichment culture TaxID=1795815 RepID=UPI003F557A71
MDLGASQTHVQLLTQLVNKANGGSVPVQLPASLNRWTNLWEPLDVLAFAASKVFQLHNGAAPVDLPVSHQASTGLWTHSAYWRLPHVASVIGEVMRQDQSATGL